jgi:hypothetical protein
MRKKTCISKIADFGDNAVFTNSRKKKDNDPVSDEGSGTGHKVRALKKREP